MVTAPDLRICPGERFELNLFSACSYCVAVVSSMCRVAQRSRGFFAKVAVLVVAVTLLRVSNVEPHTAANTKPANPTNILFLVMYALLGLKLTLKLRR